DRVAGGDEHHAAVLEIVQGVGVGGAGDVADHDAVRSARHLAALGGVFVEVVVHDRLALRGGKHAGAQADQATGGDGELQVDLALAVVHADQLAPAVADQLHHAAHVLFGHVNDQIFDRL